MGKDHAGFVKVDFNRTPRVPPGFESWTSFTLRRLQEDVTMAGGTSNSTHNLMDVDENERFKKSLRWRPWLNYSQPNDSLEGESESEPVIQDAPSVSCLPKGVLHGCVKCENCQKVMAGWRPEIARRPILDEAPVFYPTEEVPHVIYIGVQRFAQIYFKHTAICRAIWNMPYCPSPILEASLSSQGKKCMGKFKVSYSHSAIA